MEEEAFPFDADCIKAEKIALHLIARAEQSVAGLTAKLEKRGVDASIARQVISSLLHRKLLDDTRYAERWIRAHLGAKKPLSPLWFRVSLEKKGIKREISLNATKKILDEETEFLLLLKFIEKNGLSRTKLRYEGFSTEVINRFFDSE